MTTTNKSGTTANPPWPKILTKPSVPMPVVGGAPRIERPIATESEWTMGTLEAFDKAIAEHAKRLGLETFPIQYEMITADQMIDLVSTVGMPVYYPHWSYGKQLVSQEYGYKRGRTGLAYEIVINTNPSLVYLMENNTLALQVLVMAHAGYGHNAFFRNNYLFKQFTQPDAILDYLQFARKYILDCEERFGAERVEKVLDSAHTISMYGVDRYKRRKLSKKERAAQAKARREFDDRHYNPDYALIYEMRKAEEKAIPDCVDDEFAPQENLLYFIEKRAQRLTAWEKEVVRIVRKTSQYFYPQRLTKVANEGAATFWHYTLLHELYDAGQVDDGFMLEWLANHSDVVTQLPFNAKHYHGINPYALGFAIFRDIRRICEHPTDEDREWFPDLAGKNWVEEVHAAMEGFVDDSLIEQYLSPKVMRDLRLFNIRDNADNPSFFTVEDIHNEKGYREVRRALACMYRMGYFRPQLDVVMNENRDERALLLRHTVEKGRMLDGDSVKEVLPFIKELWHFDVAIDEVDEDGTRIKIHRS